jgi:hypothetical protein
MAKAQNTVRITGNVVRITTFRRPKRGRPKPAAVEVFRVHPDALSEALRLAKGDKRRLLPQRDGSVMVVNRT